jgi:HPr kinase/phosphorylase
MNSILRTFPPTKNDRVSEGYRFEQIVERLRQLTELEALTSVLDSRARVAHADVHRPGMGFVDGYHEERVQILGMSECGFLESISEADQRVAIRRILGLNVPGLFVANGRALPRVVIEEAERDQTPIVLSRLATDELTLLLRDVLADLFAPRLSLHGTLVDCYGVGLLFTGRSGIGKSETALDLVERGHRLVADDLVQVVKRSSDVLMGGRREGIGHVLEIRGVGIVDILPVFGVRSIRMQKRIEVEVRLEEWNDDRDYDRHGLDREETEYLGVKIPRVVVPIVAGKNSSVIAEVIALDFMLRTYGIESAEEFNRKLIETMSESGNTWRYLQHDLE